MRLCIPGLGVIGYKRGFAQWTINLTRFFSVSYFPKTDNWNSYGWPGGEEHTCDGYRYGSLTFKVCSKFTNFQLFKEDIDYTIFMYKDKKPYQHCIYCMKGMSLKELKEHPCKWDFSKNVDYWKQLTKQFKEERANGRFKE